MCIINMRPWYFRHQCDVIIDNETSDSPNAVIPSGMTYRWSAADGGMPGETLGAYALPCGALYGR